MRIRALANGNVIEADDDAAKQLIDAGIYEAAGDEPVTASLTPPVPPATTSRTESSKPARQTKRRKTR